MNRSASASAKSRDGSAAHNAKLPVRQVEYTEEPGREPCGVRNSPRAQAAGVCPPGPPLPVTCLCQEAKRRRFIARTTFDGLDATTFACQTAPPSRSRSNLKNSLLRTLAATARREFLASGGCERSDKFPPCLELVCVPEGTQAPYQTGRHIALFEGGQLVHVDACGCERGQGAKALLAPATVGWLVHRSLLPAGTHDERLDRLGTAQLYELQQLGVAAQAGVVMIDYDIGRTEQRVQHRMRTPRDEVGVVGAGCDQHPCDERGERMRNSGEDCAVSPKHPVRSEVVAPQLPNVRYDGQLVHACHRR